VKKNELNSRLTRYRQIKLIVIGRKSGKTISIPILICFVSRSRYFL
jgi:hypothetical protein